MEFFVRDRLEMLRVILANTWVVLADDLIESLFDLGAARGMRIAWFLDLAGVWHFIGARSRHSVVVSIESVPVNAEGSALTVLSVLTKV